MTLKSSVQWTDGNSFSIFKKTFCNSQIFSRPLVAQVTPFSRSERTMAIVLSISLCMQSQVSSVQCKFLVKYLFNAKKKWSLYIGLWYWLQLQDFGIQISTNLSNGIRYVKIVMHTHWFQFELSWKFKCYRRRIPYI